MPGELDNPRTRADLAHRLALQSRDPKVAAQLEELAATFLAEAVDREAAEMAKLALDHIQRPKLEPA